ncbi:MAG TPA: DUF6675 family protein [Rectinemataceae bacterium]|nr:DUF6675 family protein [Rectinemataceae bacterium]
MKVTSRSRVPLAAAAVCALWVAALGSARLAAEATAAPASPALLEQRSGFDLMGAAAMDEIAAKGSILALGSGGTPKLLPDYPGAEPIREALAREKPQVLVEALFFYPRPAPSGAKAQSAELAYIYGLMRDFSTLRGITYYSQTQKSMQTLYVEAYRVAGPKDLTRVEDPRAPEPGAIPAKERFYAFQQDQRFGKNVYRYDFTSYPDGFLVDTTNETQMNFLFFPIFKPEKLEMRLLLIPAKDGIVFYVESGAEVPGFLRGLVGESFQSRAAALFNWFRDRFKEPASP